MLIGYLLLLTQNPADEVVARSEAYLRGAKSLSVEFKVHASTIPGDGSGKLVFRRPGDLAFHVKWLNSDYSYFLSAGTGLEIERSLGHFRDFMRVDSFGVPAPALSMSATYGFPRMLTEGGPRSAVPAGTRFRLISKASGSESPFDKVVADYRTPAGPAKLTVSVDAQGHIRQIEYWMGGEQEITLTHAYTNYVANGQIPNSSFVAQIPAGFEPASLPSDFPPLQTGQSADLSGLARIGSASRVDLRKRYGQSPVVLLLLDAECEPSTRWLAFVESFADRLAASGAKLAVVWRGAKSRPVSGRFEAFRYPSGDALDHLQAPGTPVTMVLKPNNEVDQVWYGFDPEIANRYRSELLEAVKRVAGTG